MNKILFVQSVRIVILHIQCNHKNKIKNLTISMQKKFMNFKDLYVINNIKFDFILNIS